MDARQLTYFLAVVDHGGFNRAAEHLFIAQPSLSQAIAGLERDLGVKLFHRIGRQVLLSEAGQALVGPARVVLRDLEAARSSVDAVRGVRSGRLDISSMPSPGIEPLTTLATSFLTRHPLVTLNVEAAFTADDVIRAVRSGSCEVGLAGGREPFRIAGVNIRPIEQQPIILIVNPHADTFGTADRVHRKDLEGHRFIVSQRGSLMRWVLDDILASGVDAHIAVEVAHRTSILPMVLAGVGHAVMPSAWSPLAHSSGLRTLTIRPVSLLHVAVLSRASGLTPTAEAFLASVDELRDGQGRSPVVH